MYVNTINDVMKHHMPAERETQNVADFDSAVILGSLTLTMMACPTGLKADLTPLLWPLSMAMICEFKKPLGIEEETQQAKGVWVEA